MSCLVQIVHDLAGRTGATDTFTAKPERYTCAKLANEEKSFKRFRLNPMYKIILNFCS
jgi:hypothetical protein